MKHIINSGIYDIDLKGKNKDEFMGNHPTLILKSIKNEAMFYAFPLTTFNPERWSNYKRNGCCRITTTNSIVRIDKVMILHRTRIKNRWIKGDIFIIPTPKEIRVVYKAYLNYIKMSSEKSINAYEKYYSCYNNFIKKLHKHFIEGCCQNDFIMDFDNRTIQFNHKLVYYLTFDDIKHCIYCVLNKNDISVRGIKDKKCIEILIKNNDLLLTLKNKYVKI